MAVQMYKYPGGNAAHSPKYNIDFHGMKPLQFASLTQKHTGDQRALRTDHRGESGEYLSIGVGVHRVFEFGVGDAIT